MTKLPLGLPDYEARIRRAGVLSGKYVYAPEFLEFYKKGLDHIIALNRKGTDIAEIFAKLLLTKILTPLSTSFVDLQSPAGAGISVAVYNYDGDVYASSAAHHAMPEIVERSAANKSLLPFTRSTPVVFHPPNIEPSPSA